MLLYRHHYDSEKVPMLPSDVKGKAVLHLMPSIACHAFSKRPFSSSIEIAIVSVYTE